MKTTRKRYSADFKAKVALEALRGELTTAQLASKHGIHQTMVGEWKKQAMEGLTAVFSDRSAAAETASDVAIVDLPSPGVALVTITTLTGPEQAEQFVQFVVSVLLAGGMPVGGDCGLRLIGVGFDLVPDVGDADRKSVV